MYRLIWLTVFAAAPALNAQSAALSKAIAKAAAYLEDEVPRWHAENGCYSCHNNGDGARALLKAGRASAVADTMKFLKRIEEWQGKGQERGSAVLSTVQFASALLASSPDPALIERAADRVAAAQLPDGHWQVDEEQSPGSPVTYGPFLATYLAREVLRSSRADRHRDAIGRAGGWLERTPPRHMADRAAVALALNRESDAATLRELQTAGGSWNGEVFDTAVAVLALVGRSDAASMAAVRRAGDFLIGKQLGPGGWPGSTTPPGGQSYAQHISTTAWALLALTALQP